VRPAPVLPSALPAATTIEGVLEEGVLERVTYANDENAGSVVKLVVSGGTIERDPLLGQYAVCPWRGPPRRAAALRRNPRTNTLRNVVSRTSVARQ
jgi:hypothetical protein